VDSGWWRQFDQFPSHEFKIAVLVFGTMDELEELIRHHFGRGFYWRVDYHHKPPQ
jgi:hypothetical protein